MMIFWYELIIYTANYTAFKILNENPFIGLYGDLYK